MTSPPAPSVADLAAEEAKAERDALAERVGFLVAEAHDWQPKLEAAEADRDRWASKAAGNLRGWNGATNRAEAAEAALDAAREALREASRAKELLGSGIAIEEAFDTYVNPCFISALAVLTAALAAADIQADSKARASNADTEGGTA